MSKTLLKYAVALAAGLIIALALALSKDAFNQPTVALTAQYLCDACFVAGVMLGGVGLMAFVASDGFFDMLGFGLKKMLSLFSTNDKKMSGSFYDYKVKKMAGRGGFGYLIITGALFLAAAGGLLILYNNA